MTSEYCRRKWLLFFFLLFGAVEGNEILVNTQDGEAYVLDIDPEESLRELQDKIASLSHGEATQVIFNMPPRGREKNIREEMLKMSRIRGGYLGYPRNYSAILSSSERSDIRFIVLYLANKSLVSIAVARPELEAAGDRIDHVHPLRFLMAIFTDEELKVAVKNMRNRQWVWNNFVKGIKDSLATETMINNIQLDMLHHFAETVKIDLGLIMPTVKCQQWEDFIDLLIVHIPRAGDYDRYDT